MSFLDFSNRNNSLLIIISLAHSWITRQKAFLIFGPAPTLGQVLYDVRRLNNYKARRHGTVVNVVPGRSGTLSNL